MNKDEIIETLGMEPLRNEGGFVREVYRGEKKDGRESYSTIFYLLNDDSCSIMHKLDGDEVWYFHDGETLEMLLIYEDHDEVVRLGKDLLHGECLQIRVPRGVWQGAHLLKEKGQTLVSTSMIPAYDISGFQAGDYEELKNKTTHQELLSRLCSRPVFE